MATTQKAMELSAELADELRKRVSASFVSIVETVDANQNPVITLSDGTPAAGEKTIVIRTIPMPWIFNVDSLGLTAGRFTPHIMQYCFEANPAAGAGADIITQVEMLPVLACITSRGTQVDGYLSTNGVVPTTAIIDAASVPTASYVPSLYWGFLAQQ